MNEGMRQSLLLVWILFSFPLFILYLGIELVLVFLGLFTFGKTCELANKMESSLRGVVLRLEQPLDNYGGRDEER